MKKMNIKLMLVVAVLLVAQATFAQRGDFRRGGERGEQRMEHLKTELELTDKQVQKLEAINEKYDEKFKALREVEGDRMEKREEMQKLRESQKAEFEKILTKDQKAKLEKLHEERSQMRTERKEGSKENRAEMKEKMKGFHEEVKAYKEENIMPVLKEQRKKLDKELTKAERKQVKEWRKSLEAEKEKMKELKEEFKANHQKGERPSEEHRAAMKKIHEAGKETKEAVKALADKYENEIAELHEEIKPQAQKWESDLKAIAEKHDLPAKKEHARHQEWKEKGAEKEMKGEQRKPRHDKHHKGSHAGKMSKVAFILLDPNAETTTAKPMNQDKKLRVFPNPAMVSNTLEYQVATSGKVTIELRNKDGQLIKTVFDGYQEAGTHKVEVNLAELNEKAYFYLVRDGEGQQTIKFLKTE